MNAKIDSGTPPHIEEKNAKEKKESIVNRLACATLEGVNAHERIERSDILEALSYRRR